MKRAVSTLEYAFLIIILALSITAMSHYIKRGFGGRWRNVGDTFGYGRQYGPGVTSVGTDETSICQDGACNGIEDCASCPQDCGVCVTTCPDGVCDPATEDCNTCPVDCGVCPVCPDGKCNGAETCVTCSVDCPGTPKIGGGFEAYCCGNDTCEPAQGENNSNCHADCHCGNGICEPNAPENETADNCPADCGSGCVEHQCGTAAGETPACFLANTQIALSNGSLKNIEDIKSGDNLLGFDEKTGKKVVSKVIKTFIHKADEYLILNGKTKVTATHPFYSDGKWVEIGKLKKDNNLLNINLEKISLKSVKKVMAKATLVYNLEVDTYHNYFADGYLVHNKKPCLCKPGGCGFNYCDKENWCRFNCCGNTFCDSEETCITCHGDCPGTAIPAGSGFYPYCCGDSVCEAGSGETCVKCPGDCTQTPCCGSGICEPSEPFGGAGVYCEADCHCGYGPCPGGNCCQSSLGENCANCGTDCRTNSNPNLPPCCKNGACDNGETAITCPQDCYCGNHNCDAGENCTNCGDDCYSTCPSLPTCTPNLNIGKCEWSCNDYQNGCGASSYKGVRVCMGDANGNCFGINFEMYCHTLSATTCNPYYCHMCFSMCYALGTGC